MKYGEVTRMKMQHTDIVAVETDSAAAVVTAFLSQVDTCQDSTKKLYARTVRQFVSWINTTGRNISSLTKKDIISFRDDLMKGNAAAGIKPKSPFTVSSYLGIVKMLYQWTEANMLYPNIAAGVRLPRRETKYRRDYLEPETARKFVEEVSSTASLRDAAIIGLMLRAGLRTVEVVRADVGDLESVGGCYILAVHGKGHSSKDTRINLPSKCADALRAYLATRSARAEEPLFLSESNNNKSGRMSTRAVSRIARTHLDAVGLEQHKFTAHSLRHTCACLMLEGGSTMLDVKGQLRHASVNTTEIYTHNIDEHQRLRRSAVSVIDNII